MIKKPIILVIDDDSEIRNLFKWMLESAGYQVELGVDGFDGLNKYHAFHPDLIFLDIKMPEMDGVRALQEIRKSDPEQHCPVLVLTGFSDHAHLDEMLKCGAQDFISKPFKLNDLHEKIHSILGAQRMA
ncbi:MAG: response regulator [Candidatus Zhuqueibacterota bacterium]